MCHADSCESVTAVSQIAGSNGPFLVCMLIGLCTRTLLDQRAERLSCQAFLVCASRKVLGSKILGVRGEAAGFGARLNRGAVPSVACFASQTSTLCQLSILCPSDKLAMDRRHHGVSSILHGAPS